jgi:hypothetical protein
MLVVVEQEVMQDQLVLEVLVVVEMVVHLVLGVREHLLRVEVEVEVVMGQVLLQAINKLVVPVAPVLLS